MPLNVQSTPRDLNTRHVPTTPSDRAAWEARTAHLRRQLTIAAGLDPMPERGKMKTIVTDSFVVDDIAVENVAIETWPGFWLAGTVYKPAKMPGKLPAVLNAHGHWTLGRLTREADVEPPAPGAAPAAGRADLVALGVNLARQGMVVFAYDMPGYADTTRVSHEYAGNLTDWLWGVSLLGLQTWNSLRVVDYLSSRPDVDRRKIGITGASGGGSQAFLLAAIDNRIAACAPVNMVSSTMQGGCLCENGPGLRVGTDNIEIAALFAPKPQLLVSCNGDWTRLSSTVEFPAVRKFYALYNAEPNVTHVHTNYQHNYNKVAREAVYGFFAKTLCGKGDGSPIAERPIALDPARLHVWNSAHPLPNGALDDASLAASWRENRQKAADARIAAAKSGDKKARAALIDALRTSLAITVPPTRRSRSGSVATIVVATDIARAQAKIDELRASGHHASLLILPLPERGGDALWGNYFSGYNPTPIADRVHEIFNTAVAAWEKSGSVNLIGIGDAGVWTILARGVLGDLAPGKTDADLDGFDNSDRAYLAKAFAPCLRAAGGVTAARAIASSPH